MTKARDLGDNAQNTKPKVIDAKGDLIVGTGADAASRLATGNNGETLVADSSASTGLRWQGNFAAGKNKILNSDFSIWQRGTSATYTSGTQNYLADRWFSWISGTYNVTVSQQTFTPGSAPVAGYEGQFFYRHAVNSVSGQSIQAVGQRIEDVRTFAGQTVTLSFWAKADASRTYTTRLIQNFGSGGSGEVSATGGSHSVTTSWQRFSVTISVPSISGKTIGTSSYLSPLIDGPVNTANTLDIWGVQLEAGNVATAFQTATGTLAGELQAAQRYYVRLNHPTDGAFPLSSSALNYSTTGGFALFALPANLRTSAHTLEYSNIRYVDANLGIFTPTFTLGGSVGNLAKADFTTTGMTTGRAGWVSQNSSTSGYVAFSAEL